MDEANEIVGMVDNFDDVFAKIKKILRQLY
jgi:hypothetical protein